MWGRVLASILGFAWSLAAFFVIPVMIYEKLPPVAALKKSFELFKKTWGEMIVVSLGTGIIFFIAVFIGMIAFFPAIIYVSGINDALVPYLFVSLFIYIGVVMVFAYAIQGILIAALYHYAKTRRVPKGFPPNLPNMFAQQGPFQAPIRTPFVLETV